MSPLTLNFPKTEKMQMYHLNLRSKPLELLYQKRQIASQAEPSHFVDIYCLRMTCIHFCLSGTRVFEAISLLDIYRLRALNF